METTLYTIHAHKDGRDHLRLVGDGKHPLGAIPPLWAIWRGLWITAGVEAVVLLALLILAPAILGTVYFGLVALTMLEGSTIERTELWARGWREVGLTEARSEEGAEDTYRQGLALEP
ncbi:MAG: hypothetical protein ACFBWO_03745 [Paracoccaceae bacterium]